MTQLSRVVWREGMHLAQHHFQAQNRYFEDSIQFAVSHLFFAPYGLIGCELDANALRNGTVSMIHARGVMPDGMPFHIPDGDAAPPPLAIGDRFSPTSDNHVVYLTIAPYRRDAANCIPADAAAADGRGARYVSEPHLMLDETTGHDEKPVTLGRKNFRLALDTSLEDGAVALAVARVRRDGRGSFAYDTDYIPPLLQIGASDRLMTILGRLVEMLDAKSAALGAGTGRQSLGDWASHEVAMFWLMHAVHSALGPLRHHVQVKRSRPEQVYAEMSRLAGALCTFSLDAHPRMLPSYDHDQLEVCFDTLDRHIRASLDIIIPTNCVSVPLRSTSAFMYTGPVSDTRCFGRARWFLGVRSSVGEAETITRVPRFVKVCSAKFTPELVKRAFPGLTLEHVPAPPAALSPRVDAQYFSISKAGPCWETLVQTQEIGVYVPDALPGADVQVLILLES
ncbi:MAG TPA: type VI secretion system baseplate subunit TssK [Gemmatimonadaceae bacterium]|nr:type VI secretion system baseplate subunit TssK [Gemmatimonadaceae bacterium]